jgi:hypothetical protein
MHGGSEQKQSAVAQMHVHVAWRSSFEALPCTHIGKGTLHRGSQDETGRSSRRTAGGARLGSCKSITTGCDSWRHVAWPAPPPAKAPPIMGLAASTIDQLSRQHIGYTSDGHCCPSPTQTSKRSHRSTVTDPGPPLGLKCISAPRQVALSHSKPCLSRSLQAPELAAIWCDMHLERPRWLPTARQRMRAQAADAPLPPRGLSDRTVQGDASPRYGART